MTSLTVALAMQMALIGASPNDDPSYAAAHAETTKTGRPLVILVGAKWCPACVQMKASVVPKLKQSGVLRTVSYAEVDIDKERDLGRELTRGGPIPQLLMYRHTKAGWRLRRIIGGQNAQNAERFIAEGIALDRHTKKIESQSIANGRSK